MRRRLMLRSSAGVTPVLPAEYQQVEYIGGTGTQWIQTNFVPSVGQSTICKFSASVYPSTINVFYTLYAAGTSPKQVFASIGFTPSMQQNSIFPALFSATATIFFNAQSGTEYTLTCDYNASGSLCSIDGKSATTPTPQGITQTDILTFFKRLAATTNYFVGNLHEFVVYQGTTEYFHAYPCYRKADGEIGIYDIVSQTFYTNAGTGTFTKGADI